DLGGHSLLAVKVTSRVRQTLEVELGVDQMFSHPSLSALASAVGQAAKSNLPAITLASRDEPLPLSYAQQRLWFLAQMDGVSQAYHIPMGLRMQGKLDRATLRRALNRIVARHEALRTTFMLEHGQPMQRIAPADTGFVLQEHDLRSESDIEAALKALAEAEAGAPFDLAAGPLARGQLIRTTDDDHVLLVTMHHIVSDGWSQGILINEFSALYNAYRDGREDPLPPLAIQYADYTIWQRRWIDGEMLQAQASYWQQALTGGPVLLKLPTDRPRPAQQDFASAFTEVAIDASLTDELKALSARHGTTLFMTLLAGWAAVLARLSGQDDVVIGTPNANRTRAEVEPLIGFFVNTLAIRLKLSGEPTVSNWLQQVRQQTLDAQQHQDLPFEQIVEILNPPRSSAHTPIFQAVFAWHNNEGGKLELGDLTLEPVDAPYPVTKFDLTLNLSETNGAIVGGIEYAAALFDPATIERHRSYLLNLLRAMVDGDEQPVPRLSILSAAERERILTTWNATAAAYPRHMCIHEIVEEHARRSPKAVAVIHGGREITYRDLNAEANRLARYLRASGIGESNRVAILLRRSIGCIVAQLALVKCGAAFVTLDPGAPDARQHFIIDDCQARILITQSEIALSDAPGVMRVDLDQLATSDQSSSDLLLSVDSENPAHVSYTSGSTGHPKGVVVPHRAIGRVVLNNGYGDFRAEDRFAYSTNPAWDASTLEVWGALLNGASIAVIDQEDVLEPAQFGHALQANAVNVLWMGVGLFNQYAASLSDVWPRLRYLIVGGDALDPRVIARVLRDCAPHHLINGYGPTETTVFAATHEVEAVAEDARSVPIGRPISNTQIYILDSYLQPVPIGAVGEIYIGGDGVTLGYLNRPDLTAERFVVDPFSSEPNARMYKSGDLGRYDANGVIDFMGRNDTQVKLRGFRVELGEIEAKLLEQEGVREAVVLAREDQPGDKRLVAYLTMDAEIDTEALRAALSASLPEYMVPAAYVQLDTLPLTSNGKLDRKALPAPEDDAYGSRGYEAPVGETETALADIWAEVLRLERVGRH
ncbi:non-ribosomal peptide synthetase, partial [Noviherbaspirillum sp.]|uniref:non-ribosomal peptide synthetase n=1 Tax=Noviherbaspirillum sp. TaxID=1926288 RepID=UPI002FDF84E6